MDLADGGGSEGFAGVGLAPCGEAVVVLVGGVLCDEGLAIAAVAAATQLRVEALEGVGVDLAGWDVAEDRADVALDVEDVPGAGAVLDLAGPQPFGGGVAEGDG
ncbi:MAG TPA: hypothetical protein VGX25_02020 [Actinophytocola sp.]|uniref:hypothetical protein n=1 Tax=Actinophytocola sp. TaxID=1872138 RepID=UPI002DDCB563|nr:hypothetical protein [Actinophytocola sp.]HEV2778155.1 hypothetical protein [Actinophytocola sp.]